MRARIVIAAVLLACAAPLLEGSAPVELIAPELHPMSVVPDGDGGVILLARASATPLLARLDASGGLIWATMLRGRDVFTLVRFGDAAALVARDPFDRESAGVRVSKVDLNGREGPRRQYTSDRPLGVMAAGGDGRRIALALVSGQAQAIVLLNEDLTAVRQYGFARLEQRSVEGVAIMPDGGAVFVGTDRGVCFAGRIDATGRPLWVNRYRLAKTSGCTHVAVTESTIFVGGWMNLQEEIALLTLEPDGAVRHAVGTVGDWMPAALAASERGALLVTHRSRDDSPTMFSFFVAGEDMPRIETGLKRRFDTIPWGVAVASAETEDLVFAAIDERRAVFAASQSGAPLSACNRFAPAQAEWKPLTIRPEPLALGSGGLEIVHGVRAPRAWEDVPLYVKSCGTESIGLDVHAADDSGSDSDLLSESLFRE